MDFLWAIIVILLILFFLFMILPSLMTTSAPVTTTATATATISNIQSAHPSSTAPVNPSKAMLDAQFAQVQEQSHATVPENYPRKPIGACPYSKPQSMDLPLGNVPMCVAVRADNMHLKPI